MWCVRAVADVSAFLVCITWRCLFCCLNGVTVSLSVIQPGALRQSVAEYCPSCSLLFLRNDLQSSWITMSVPSISGILHPISSVRWPSCVFPSSLLMLLWLPVCQFSCSSFVSWCSCSVTDAVPRSYSWLRVISNIVLLSNRFISTWRFNVHQW